MDPLYIYTMYYDPADYPGKFVVRRFQYDQPDPDPMVVSDTYTGAKAVIPQGCVKFQPDPQDEPQILEIWL